jgi:hypothetical protein
MKFNSLVLIACITALMAIGGTASAVCDDTDNNNTEATAVPVWSYNTMVSGVVCPDDPYDYYVMEVPSTLFFSGDIIFSSSQVGTVIRMYKGDTGERIIDDVFTNEATKQFNLHIFLTDEPWGIYYVRIFHWSNADYDHDYSLVFNLAGLVSPEANEPAPGLTKTFLNPCPWPNPSGTSRNANFSSFQGPSGPISRTNSVEMSKLYTDFTKPMKYEGLVVGPGSEIFFVDNNTNGFYRYKFPQRSYDPKIPGASSRPPCFDNRGKLCVIEWSQFGTVNLVCYNKFGGDKAWSAGLPTGSHYAVAAAGEQIYTKVDGPQHSLQVWDKDGNKICDLPFDSAVGGVAEDLRYKKFFVQTRKALYKFDFNGTEEWVYEGLPVRVPDTPDPWETVGPIAEYYGRVFAAPALGDPWAVFNPWGSVYKSGDGDFFLNPMSGGDSLTAVAHGSDGRFYIVTSGELFDTIRCYKYWRSHCWTVTVPHQKVYDIILDNQNRVYICFSNSSPGETPGYGWKCLDPVDGHAIVSVMDIGEPEELAESKLGAELAIGSDGQLIMLMNGGYLAVFETPTMQKGYIEMGEDKKEKFESLR